MKSVGVKMKFLKEMETSIMIKINNELFFTISDISAVIEKQPNTIRGWSKYSDELEQKAIARGEDGEIARLIPRAMRINGRRLYTWEQVQEIAVFSELIDRNRGILSEYSRRRNGKKGKEIQERVKVKKEEAEFESIKKLLDKAQRGNRSIGIGSW